MYGIRSFDYAVHREAHGIADERRNREPRPS